MDNLKNIHREKIEQINLEFIKNKNKIDIKLKELELEKLKTKYIKIKLKINERKINKKRKIFKRKIKWNANIKKEKETNYENEILENEFVAFLIAQMFSVQMKKIIKK